MFVSWTARAPGVNPSQRCEPFCFDCPYQCFLATKTMSSSLVRGEPRTSPLLTSLRVCTTFAIQQISSFNPMSTTFLRYDWLGETLGGARWRSVDLQASAGTHSEQVAEAVGKSVLSNVTASPLPSPPRFPSEFHLCGLHILAHAKRLLIGAETNGSPTGTAHQLLLSSSDSKSSPHATRRSLVERPVSEPVAVFLASHWI